MTYPLLLAGYREGAYDEDEARRRDRIEHPPIPEWLQNPALARPLRAPKPPSSGPRIKPPRTRLRHRHAEVGDTFGTRTVTRVLPKVGRNTSVEWVCSFCGIVGIGYPFNLRRQGPCRCQKLEAKRRAAEAAAG